MTLTYTDGSKRVMLRKENGCFECTCGLEKVNPNVLLQHTKYCKEHPTPIESSESDSEDAEEPPQSGSDEDVEENTEPSEKDPLETVTFDIDETADFASTRQGSTAIDNVFIAGSLTPGPPIPQLKLIEAFECNRCGIFRTTIGGFKHHGKACNGASHTKCHVQPVTVGTGSSFFKVVVQQAEEHLDAVEKALQKQMSLLAEVNDQLDIAVEELEEPPWIERTGWSDYADLRVMADLSKLTYKPQVGDRNFNTLNAIFDKTKEILYDCLDLVGRTDRITLRNLRSPSETLSKRPFSNRQHKNTHPRYFAYMARLVCFVIRLTYDDDDLAATGAVLNPNISKMAENIKCWAADPRFAKDLKSELGDLMWSLLMEPLYVDLKFGNLTVNFLALMGYCPSNKTFKTPQRFTNTLAGLMFCFRLAGLRACWKAVDEEEHSSDLTKTETFRATSAEICQHLKDSCYGTASEVLALLACGLFHYRNEAPPGQIQWNTNDNYASLNFKGEKFSIPKFIDLVKYVFVSLDEELNYLLLCNNPGEWPVLPQILYDIPSDSSPDWSFTKDPRNSGCIKNLSLFVLESVMRDPTKRKRFYRNMETVREAAAEEYIAHASRYLSLIALAIQFTCGQPIRSTELLSFRFKNTEYQQRNIYITEDRTVMITTSYSKTQQITGKLKNICRFASPSLGDHIIYYITTILPFYWYILSQSRTLEKTPLMFADASGKKWKPSGIAQFMEEEAFRVMQFELRPSKYRQIGIAIAKKYVEPLSLLMERQRAESVNIFAHQAGHNDNTRLFSYGVDSHDVVGITTELVTESRRASAYWQVFVGALEELPEWVVYPPILSSKLSKAWINALFRANETLIRQMKSISDAPSPPIETFPETPGGPQETAGDVEMPDAELDHPIASFYVEIIN
ncbi:hypothetical protein TWF173_002068 [Orbilia oligospora]|nr:hypothetical protein TWF173_002068 [Orbilia oligospora]